MSILIKGRQHMRTKGCHPNPAPHSQYRYVTIREDTTVLWSTASHSLQGDRQLIKTESFVVLSKETDFI
jgi:hypothetical protein